jgi:hypothetical protein
MDTIRWVATWKDQEGRERSYYFDAPDSRMIARLDFQLKLAEQHEQVPESFDLDEATTLLPRIQRDRW